MNNQEIITPNEQIRIGHGSHVDLHFEVSLENGTLIDSTFDRPEPVSLAIGDGSLLAGFEQVLINLTAGDTRTAHLTPVEAFGEWNVDNVQTFNKAQFALANGVPEVGTMMKFEDKGKNYLVGVISEVADDTVKVDFNHPLAGQNVLFKVKIVKVTPQGNQAVKFS